MGGRRRAARRPKTTQRLRSLSTGLPAFASPQPSPTQLRHISEATTRSGREEVLEPASADRRPPASVGPAVTTAASFGGDVCSGGDRAPPSFDDGVVLAAHRLLDELESPRQRKHRPGRRRQQEQWHLPELLHSPPPPPAVRRRLTTQFATCAGSAGARQAGPSQWPAVEEKGESGSGWQPRQHRPHRGTRLSTGRLDRGLRRASRHTAAVAGEMPWGVFVRLTNPGLRHGNSRHRRKAETPTDRLADGAFLPLGGVQRAGGGVRRDSFMSLLEADLSTFNAACSDILQRTEDSEERLDAAAAAAAQGGGRWEGELNRALTFNNVGCAAARRGSGRAALRHLQNALECLQEQRGPLDSQEDGRCHEALIRLNLVGVLCGLLGKARHVKQAATHAQTALTLLRHDPPASSAEGSLKSLAYFWTGAPVPVTQKERGG
jgi:hypothetical protein